MTFTVKVPQGVGFEEVAGGGEGEAERVPVEEQW